MESKATLPSKNSRVHLISKIPGIKYSQNHKLLNQKEITGMVLFIMLMRKMISPNHSSSWWLVHDWKNFFWNIFHTICRAHISLNCSWCVHFNLITQYSAICKLLERLYLAIFIPHSIYQGLPYWLSGKESICNAEDPGSIPGLGRSSGVGIATHSSILAWGIPWTKEHHGLQSTGSHRDRYKWND